MLYMCVKHFNSKEPWEQIQVWCRYTLSPIYFVQKPKATNVFMTTPDPTLEQAATSGQAMPATTLTSMLSFVIFTGILLFGTC